MSRVQIDQIVGVSVLEMVREAAGTIDEIRLGSKTPLIEVATLQDLLYFPSVLEPGQSLQIVRGHGMPLEAVLEKFTPAFVRQELLKRGLTTLPDAEETVNGTVCILGNVFSRNFCHWHEELMKVVVIERIGYECNYVIAELPGIARELLELLGIAPERVLEVRRPTCFRTAVFTTPISYHNIAQYPEVLLLLRERLLASAPASQRECGPRLWFDRGQQTRLGRKLVNEEEVGRVLDRYAFERVDMGSRPILSQIAIAGNTQVMGGLHGAHFVHSQLMHPRSHVIECFSPMYLNPTYTGIYRVLEHSYAQVTNRNTPLLPYAHGSDVLVDCQQLDLAMRAATRV